MKRFLAIILAGLMLLSLTACGEKKTDENVVKIGLLEADGQGGHKEHAATVHADSVAGTENVYYNNLTSAIMDLNSGKIVALGLEKSSAAYVAARNENLIFEIPGDFVHEASYSMMTMDTNKEVYDILNDAIKEMKADGTLDTLIENELTAYIESDPLAKDRPHFDGAKTIKIGVTGDLPPMDFVASNGKAAGFNIALLTEIANRAQVNFELVQIETGARAIALSNGKVDALFWAKERTCTVCGAEGAEKVEGTLVTESYFSDCVAEVKLKDNK